MWPDSHTRALPGSPASGDLPATQALREQAPPLQRAAVWPMGERSALMNGRHLATAGLGLAVSLVMGCDTAETGFDAEELKSVNMSFLAPRSGATLSHTVTLQTSAPSTTTQVTYRLDGNRIGVSSSGAPWSLQLDTTQVADGAHTLAASAQHCRSGGGSCSQVGNASISVTVSNAVAVADAGAPSDLATSPHDLAMAPRPDLATPPPNPGSWWKPAPGTSWQWQLSGTVDTSFDVKMYDIDLFDNSASQIASLKAQGRTVICYFSAGTYENWRPDAGQFPAAALGGSNGWPGEKWLDIRDATVRSIMTARLDLAVQKGCSGVEPDNVDGYSNKTGFPLTAADQLDFNRFIANSAHARNLSVGLKNDVDQVKDLVSSFDWMLDEECFQYSECNTLVPFIQAGKAVFEVEYGTQTTATKICPQANSMNFDSLVKDMNLDAFRISCR
jgi:hypothetical protein